MSTYGPSSHGQAASGWVSTPSADGCCRATISSASATSPRWSAPAHAIPNSQFTRLAVLTIQYNDFAPLANKSASHEPPWRHGQRQPIKSLDPEGH